MDAPRNTGDMDANSWSNRSTLLDREYTADDVRVPTPETKSCSFNCNKWKVLAIITGVLFAISAIALLVLFVPPVAGIVAGVIGGAVAGAKIGAICGTLFFGMSTIIFGRISSRLNNQNSNYADLSHLRQ